MIKTLIVALVIALFITFASCQDANLLVHKSVQEPEAIVHKNVTFTITLYNIGQSAAYDVEIKDNEWPAPSFEIIGGSINAKFDKIEAGQNVSYTYTVLPKITGGITTDSAIVTYKNSPEDEKKQTVKSSILPQLPIMTQAQYSKRHDSHVDEWAIFLLLTLIPVGIPGLVYLYSNNQINQLASQGKKKL